ncbi:hypothetical protein NQ317_002076 [Molorchus minor]|uniref:Transposase n=1 Tax=Molorchus minor TaxID=1323400 RepID=A0ABQ9JQ92_9CUCU|nr:hypothetical protein NQ317_002076 [Molorchus minor]
MVDLVVPKGQCVHRRRFSVEDSFLLVQVFLYGLEQHKKTPCASFCPRDWDDVL